MKKVAIVVGTRPNFIKITRFPYWMQRAGGLQWKIIHTGQHYDDAMAGVFFRQFGVTPDVFLQMPGQTREQQMEACVQALRKQFTADRPDLVLVVGDVNSTAAAARAAADEDILVGHVESGLRSFDPSMPEEHNRIEADRLAGLCFVTEQSGIDNLAKEGKPAKNVSLVGNTMIDTLVAFETEIRSSGALKRMKLEPSRYVLVTMHRPATVDTREGLERMLAVLEALPAELEIVFPVHPRTRKNLSTFQLDGRLMAMKHLTLTQPMDYFAFQDLVAHALVVVTDSGGIQEETTFRGVPCFTLRPNTERPVTVTLGTNELVPFDPAVVAGKVRSAAEGTFRKGAIPPLWDGEATRRIVEIISRVLS